jgi:hypothetical protein
MVEMLTWPFPISTDMTVPGQGVTKQTFPADTPFLGVVWEPWAWELVKAGKLRGYSIGGSAQRIEADLPVDAGVFAKEKDDVPTDMELYNRIKGEAKKKFDVYPSLYANNWLVGEYKRRGGKYKTVEKGDSPGHPFRGNQFGTGSGGPKGRLSNDENRTQQKVDLQATKMSESLSDGIRRGDMPSSDIKIAAQAKKDMKAAVTHLTSTELKPSQRKSMAEGRLQQAKAKAQQLSNNPRSQQIAEHIDNALKLVTGELK